MSSPLARPATSRHAISGCKVCPHKHRADVEKAFVNWRSLRDIAREFGISKDSVARHAEAVGLDEKRSRNVRAALTRVVEKGLDTAAISGSALVAALGVLSKLDAAGHQVDRVEVHAKVASLLPRMTDPELELYAETGALPAWAIPAAEAATAASPEKVEDAHEQR